MTTMKNGENMIKLTCDNERYRDDTNQGRLDKMNDKGVRKCKS